jgi:hypothetical protein
MPFVGKMPLPIGIVPLIKAYRETQISVDDYLHGLGRAVEICEHKKNQLITSAVKGPDRQEWEKVIRPGLLACLDVMIGAALEAREYAYRPEEQLLQNVVMLFAQIDQASDLLKQRLGLVSAEVRAIASDVLIHVQSDAVHVSPVQVGSAEVVLSLFD